MERSGRRRSGGLLGRLVVMDLEEELLEAGEEKADCGGELEEGGVCAGIGGEVSEGGLEVVFGEDCRFAVAADANIEGGDWGGGGAVEGFLGEGGSEVGYG